MTPNKNILVCKGVRFYSHQDEDAFFQWIQSIDSIKDVSAARDELYLEVDNSLSDGELRNILALFYRYKIDMKQLQRFLNRSNKKWFKEGVKGYWHRRIFGA